MEPRVQVLVSADLVGFVALRAASASVQNWDGYDMDSADNFDLPAPREPFEASSKQPVWCYDQVLKSGDRRHSAYVTTVSDTEGDRLRRQLNAVIGELLHWAVHQPGSAATPEDETSK